MGLPIIKTFAFSSSQGSSQKTNPNLYIILHEVGVNNSPAKNNASYFKHNWATSETYATFVIGHDGDYQVGTPGYVAWAALAANPYSPVQIEFERTNNREEFQKGYANYITLARYYAKKYGIPLTLDKGKAGTPGIKSHLWVTQHYGGDHTDPYGYLARWGITKTKLAHDLAHGISGYEDVTPSDSKPSHLTSTLTKPNTSSSTVSTMTKPAGTHSGKINVGTKLTLPADTDNWYVYPLSKSPIVGNQIGVIRPKKSGIVKYRIYEWTQNNVAVIKTAAYGKVQIYVGPGTGAKITGAAYPSTVSYVKTNETGKIINNKYHYYSHVPGDEKYNNYDYGIPKVGTYKIDNKATRTFKDDEGKSHIYYYYRICYNKQADGTYKSRAWINEKAFSDMSSFVKQKVGTFKVLAKPADVVANPTIKSPALATYEINSLVTIDGYIDNDGWRWVTYVNYLGKRHYVKMKSLDGKTTIGVVL